MSHIRSSSQEGLILALRSEVERLKTKINHVVSTAEMTLGQVHSEQEAIRQSFASKEEAYLREIRDRAASEAHFRDLYDVCQAELQDERTKSHDNASMLDVLRESALGTSGHPESKDDDAAARSFLAHPGQLVLRSTNSWALEVAKLRRGRESDRSELQSLRETQLQQERELAEARALLEASRQETMATAALLQEFSLAQTVLGKPKSRDQQLLGTIRQALSASTTKASRLVKKDLLAACDDEQSEARRQRELYQASLADLSRRWEEGSGEALPRLLEQLTERTAEARCLLQERSAELEAVRVTLDRQAAEKSEVLQRLAEEHEHAARWKHDKDKLLAEQQQMVQETARSATVKTEAESSLAELHAAHAALQASSDATAEALQLVQRDLEAATTQAAADQHQLSMQCAQIAALQREVTDYAHLIDGERVAEVDARLAEMTARCAPLEKELSETKARAFADALSLREALAEASQQAREDQASAADWRRKCEVAEGDAAEAERKSAKEQGLAEGRIAALAETQSRLVALETEHAVATAKLGHLLAAVDSSAREILELQQQAAASETTRASLDSSLKDRERRLLDRENLIVDMQTAVDDLMAQVAGLSEQLKEKTAWAEGAAAAHARETLALRDADRLAVSQAAQELAERAAREGQLRRELQAVGTRLESAEEQLRAESAQHYEERRRLLGDLEAAAVQADARMVPLEARISDLQDQIATQSGRAAAREEELGALVEAMREEMSSAQARGEALLQQSAARATAAEASVVETRGNLDKCIEKLRDKMAVFQTAERACDEALAAARGLEADKAALQEELEAVTESLRERDEELADLSARHAVLKDEVAEMKPHVLDLVAETELTERQARDLERLEGLLQQAQHRAEAAEKAHAEAESRHRTDMDVAALRAAEAHAHSLAKEARLKQIIATATEQLKVLEAAAAASEDKANRREDSLCAEWRLEVAELKTLLSQATRAHDEVLSVSKEEKVFSERNEATLATQIDSLQADLKARGDRYRDAEEKLRAHTAEQAQQLLALAERARKAEAQAKHHERQAAAYADETRKRDAEVDVHKGASHELYGDLKAARRQYETLVQARQADQRTFAHEIEQLRAASKAELAQKCAALAAEGEALSMSMTHRLWDAERLAEAAEEKFAKERARSSGSDEREATMQEQLRRAAEDASQQRQRHRAELEALRFEQARATAEQLEEQHRSHAAELGETIKAHRTAADGIISELQARCAALEMRLIATEGHNECLGALTAECAALQQNVDRETLKCSSLAAELARTSSEHTEQCRDLQRRLDAALALASSQEAAMEVHTSQHGPARERQAQELISVRTALESQVVEARAGAEKQAEHHARLLSEAQHALALESAALSQARAETVAALRDQNEASQRVRQAAQEERQQLVQEHSLETKVLGAQLEAAERDLRAMRSEAAALRSAASEAAALAQSRELLSQQAADDAWEKLQEALLEVSRLSLALEVQGAQHAEAEASWARQVREARCSLEEAVAAHGSEVVSLQAALSEQDCRDAARAAQLDSYAQREEASRARNATLQSRLDIADLAAAAGAAAEAVVQRLQEQLATEREDGVRSRQATIVAATAHAHELHTLAEAHAAALAGLRGEADEAQRSLEAKARAAEDALRDALLAHKQETAERINSTDQERARLLEAAKTVELRLSEEIAALLSQAAAQQSTHGQALHYLAEAHAAELSGLRGEADEAQGVLEAKVRAAEEALREVLQAHSRDAAESTRQSEQERTRLLDETNAVASHHTKQLAYLQATHAQDLALAGAAAAQLSQLMADKDKHYQEQVDKLVADQEAATRRVSELEQASLDFVVAVAALQRRLNEAVDAAAETTSEAERLRRELDAARSAAKGAEDASVAREASLERAVQDLERARRDDATSLKNISDDLESSRCEIAALTASLSESEFHARQAVAGHARKMEGLQSKLRGMRQALDARTSSHDPVLLDDPEQAFSSATGDSTAPFYSPHLAAPSAFSHEQSEQSETDLSVRRALSGQSVAPDTPGPVTAELTLNPSTEMLSHVDASIAELRASMHEVGSESSPSALLAKLTICLACYADLKSLYLRCEDEFHNAARILIDTAEGSRAKQRGRIDQLGKLLDAERRKCSRLKTKLAGERGEYREALENLSLRMAVVDSDEMGDSGDSDDSLHDDDEGDSVGSAASDAPSAFTISTEQRDEETI